MTDVAEDVAADGMPAEFAGEIGIEWPAADFTAARAMPGWKVSVYDDGGPVTTVTSASVVAHTSADGVIWAEVTMFADEDGRPVPHLPPGRRPYIRDGEYVTGTFPFLVTGMRMAGQS